jgi:hypothetical protein
MNQTEKLALKDLEIMRLREAGTFFFGWVDDVCCELAEDAYEKYKLILATPTTYDDLMAWHEAQLGEPVAITKQNGLILKFGFDELPENTNLYAKKG